MTTRTPEPADAAIKALLARFSSAELLELLRAINSTALSAPEIVRAIRREEKLKFSPKPGRPSMLRRWLKEGTSEEVVLRRAEREGASKTTLWRLRRVLASRQPESIDDWLSTEERAGRLATTIEAREFIRNIRSQTPTEAIPKTRVVLGRRNSGELDALIRLSQSGFDALFEERSSRTYRLRATG
jgi:hypothetical protein